MKIKYYNVIIYKKSCTLIHVCNTLQSAYYECFESFRTIPEVDYCEIWEHNYDDETFEDNKAMKDIISIDDYIELLYNTFFPID